MSNRLNSLRFVIGVFFTLLAVILIAGYFISAEQHRSINIYSALVFGIFGVIMMSEKQDVEQ